MKEGEAMARILVIDDDPAMRRLIARTLTMAGHSVCEAADGREGIALFDQILPALVITDIVMPGAEGIETILKLRKIAEGVKILAISGWGSSTPSYLDMATKLGADVGLSKPFKAEKLLAAVESLLVECGSAWNIGRRSKVNLGRRLTLVEPR